MSVQQFLLLKIRVIIAVASLYALLAGCSKASWVEESVSAEELSNWRTLDLGKTTVSADEMMMEELEGSDGYFLISPESYEGDLKLNYKVKAMSEASVLIVLFAASDKGDSGDLTLPPAGTKGVEFWRWRTQLEHYNLTFNNLAHGNKPFFFKNETPLKRGFYQNSAENIMEVGQWYDVEIGKEENRLWFKLDEKLIFEQTDYETFSNGHLMFRISGLNGENVIFAKAAIKDLVISHK